MRVTARDVKEGYSLVNGRILRVAETGGRVRFKTTGAPEVSYSPTQKVEVVGVPAELVAINDRSLHGPSVEVVTRPREGILVFTMDDGTTQTYSTGETFYLWRY